MTSTTHLRAFFACLLFATLFFTPSLAFDIEEDTGSLMLTDLDFEQAVSQNQYLLVNFHALWCRYSKALKPEWKTLSTSLTGPLSPVKLAKVEAYDEKKVAEEYGIEGFPTIKFFMKGTPYDYKGERNATHIVEFLNRKLKNSLSVISDSNAVKDKLKEYDWVGVYIGDTDDDNVKNVAFDIQDVLFVRIGANAGKTLYSDTANTKFVLVNNITGGHDNLAGDITHDSLTDFINSKKFPPVARVSRGTVEQIFLNEEPALLLIRRESDDDNVEKAFNDARTNSALQGVFMAIANTKDEVDNRLATNLGLNSSDLPAVVIVRADRERIRKYKLDGSITADSVAKFYGDYKTKKAKRLYLSEPVPETNTDHVKKVVTNSFTNMVLDATKDVLLLIWTPWCGHCRAMMPVYDNVARKTREVPNFVVAKIDASLNDLEGFELDIVEYPTILLFRATDKKNPIEFRGERNEYVFDKFIHDHASVNLQKMKGPNPFSKNDL